MGDETDVGFLPVKPKLCNNLFSEESFDHDMEVSSMSEQSCNMDLSKFKVPRRRLTLSSDSTTPKLERKNVLSSSFESGLEIDSPLSECPDIDSPHLDYIRSRMCSNSSIACDMRRRCALGSSTSPVMRKSLSPMLLFDDSPSFKPIFNGCLEEKHSDLSICEMADEFPDLNQDFKLKKRTFGQRPHSAPTVNMSLDEDFEYFGRNIVGGNVEDDSFFDGLSQGEISTNMSPSVPSSYMELIAAPMVNNTRTMKEELTGSGKENQPHFNFGGSMTDHVFQQPVLPLKARSISCSGKRGGPLSDKSPVLPSKKKQRTKCGRSNSVYDGDPALWPLQPLQSLDSPRILQRSQSFDSHNVKSPSVDITSLLDMDDKNLIGDKSKKYCLPATVCKHPDLKAITPETLTAVMDDEFKDVVEELIIVDCRYPYEYEGGHIKGAINIHEKQGIIDNFLKNPLRPKDKRLILVFHCEFSSKRGPTLCRFLRNKDRDIHANFYPKLYYPEMYLLEGGYKQFFETRKKYCEPQGYREMFDRRFQHELKLFTRRSKSWSEENSLRYRNRSNLRY